MPQTDSDAVWCCDGEHVILFLIIVVVVFNPKVEDLKLRNDVWQVLIYKQC